MNLLILGANSEVAQEIAKKFAQYEHADTYMCSRNLSLLEKSCTDIQIRYGVKAKPLIFDATDYNSHESFYKNLGFIIALSSVAGERGRKSNYIYGAAKGGLTIYLSGLRNRLYHNNVRVISVLPGMVRTKMTAHLNISDRLLAETDEIAEDVYTAYKKNKDIIYTKWYWRFIMTIIKLIPEKLFKRLNLN
jgi:short-subunit dehydrogenase